MTDPSLKTLIKEMIHEITDDELMADETPLDRLKDDLQSVMLAAAGRFFKEHTPPDPPGQSGERFRAYTELEDLLVDGMMNFRMPQSAGVDEGKKITHDYMDTEKHHDRWDDEPPAGPPERPGDADELTQWVNSMKADKKQGR